MLLRESLGISADGTEKAFPLKEVEALMTRQGPQISFSRRRPEDNCSHLFVACDPSGGGASAFSIASLAQDARGFLHVRRAAPASPEAPPTYELAQKPSRPAAPAAAPCP